MKKYPPMVSVVTLTANEARKGYELRFPEPPDEAVRTVLKENGWKCNPFGTKNKWEDPLWYKQQSEESLKFARRIVTLFKGADKTAPAKPAPQTVEVVGTVQVALPQPTRKASSPALAFH